jgi:hypothetical protein
LRQPRVDLRRDDLGVYQPAPKLPLLARRLRFANPMHASLTQVDAYLQKHSYNRPGKCDQATHIMKSTFAIPKQFNYGTIKSEAVRHGSSPVVVLSGNITLPQFELVDSPLLLIFSVNQD